MRVGVVRVLVVAAGLIWLAGCETISKGPESLKSLASANAPDADPDATGSIKPPSNFLPGSPPRQPDLAGEDPNDDLNLGKRYFRQGSFGLAERHFRKAVERSPEDAESWMGLAASYDRLKRFDLADRAYGQAIRLVGATPEIMNNQGFSFMLRGDHVRARTTLLAAQKKDPASPYIKNNLVMLDQMLRKAKGINQP
jgi:tetratricopeptide (TPR) repeat protein